MFGIGGFELFIILLFGFLLFGPDKLPEMAKTLGSALRKFKQAHWVTPGCTGCGVCLTLGCSALSRDAGGHAVIDTTLCIGCGHCAQYCGFKAIEPRIPEGLQHLFAKSSQGTATSSEKKEA